MVVLPRSLKFSPALMVAVSPDVSVALMEAGRSCMGAHGWIIANAFCASGALGFASAAIANVVFAGAAGGS